MKYLRDNKSMKEVYFNHKKELINVMGNAHWTNGDTVTGLNVIDLQINGDGNYLTASAADLNLLTGISEQEPGDNIIVNVIRPANYLYVSKNGYDSGNGGAGNPYLTISAAITAASANTTIFVWPGTYTENINFKAGVNITSPIDYAVTWDCFL